MTFPEIAQCRLITQQLADTKITSAVEMVAWLGAVQGQEYAQTKWGLGLRLPGVNDEAIEADLTAGRILRTHLLRPTWHIVSAQDIRWLLTLTAARVNAANAYMYRQLELDSRIFNRCNKMIIKALQGGGQLTRDDINEVFKKNRILAQGHRLSYIMMRAELDGIICSGARKGNQFTYALLDERVKRAKSLTREEGFAELAARYFKSRGPATDNDFATWSGLTLTDCRKGIEAIKPMLNKETIKGQDYYFTTCSLADHKSLKKIYLLPVYDEFIMGYKDRSALMIVRDKTNAPFRYDNMILFEGQIAGTWKRTVGKNSIDVTFDLFKPFSKAQNNELDAAVDRLGEFTGMKVTCDR